MKEIILPVSPSRAACTPYLPAMTASCWSAADSMETEQRWLTFNSTERAFTPSLPRTRRSRYFPQPASILWPKLSSPASLSYSHTNTPSLSRIPSETHTTTALFTEKHSSTFFRNASWSKGTSGRYTSRGLSPLNFLASTPAAVSQPA